MIYAQFSQIKNLADLVQFHLLFGRFGSIPPSLWQICICKFNELIDEFALFLEIEKLLCCLCILILETYFFLCVIFLVNLPQIHLPIFQDSNKNAN